MKSSVTSLILSVLLLSTVHSSDEQVNDKVLVLDGIDDRIETVFDLAGAPQNNFTIEVWVKPAIPINIPDQGGKGSSNHGSVIYPETGRSIAQFDGHNNGGVGLSVGNNGVVVFIQPKIYGGPYHHQVALLVHRTRIDEWTHIAVVFTDRQPVLYLNGTFVVRGITSSVQAWLLPRQIGGSKDGFGNYTGMIDDMRLWNRALRFEEIEKHAKKQVSDKEAGLILYYDCNRIDGDGTLPDLSYKGHKGLLMNGISIENRDPVPIGGVAVVSEPEQGQNVSDIDSITSEAKTRRPEGIAIIIGIERYKDAPPAAFAKNDALTFERYASATLGIPKDNIYTITDEEATLGEFMKLFGRNGYLKRRTNEHTDIFIYYSGHGAPDLESKMPYLIPHDIDPDYPTTGYSTKTLYDDLGSLNARSITVFLDACFSGATRSNEMLLANARPVRIQLTKSEIPENLTVITASSGAQISSGYPSEGHGLFSYYLMKGLEKGSDTNADSKVTIEELFEYIRVQVSITAGRLDREQTPEMFTNSREQVLVEY